MSHHEILIFETLINYKLLFSVISGHMVFLRLHAHQRLQESVCVYTPHPCQFSVFAAISEVMTGNHQQGDLNEQPQSECYSKFSACSTGALHFPPSHCWYNRWVEWGHIMNSAACPELCANSMSVPQWVMMAVRRLAQRQGQGLSGLCCGW